MPSTGARMSRLALGIWRWLRWKTPTQQPHQLSAVVHLDRECRADSREGVLANPRSSPQRRSRFARFRPACAAVGPWSARLNEPSSVYQIASANGVSAFEVLHRRGTSFRLPRYTARSQLVEFCERGEVGEHCTLAVTGSTVRDVLQQRDLPVQILPTASPRVPCGAGRSRNPAELAGIGTHRPSTSPARLPTADR